MARLHCFLRKMNRAAGVLMAVSAIATDFLNPGDGGEAATRVQKGIVWKQIVGVFRDDLKECT